MTLITIIVFLQLVTNSLTLLLCDVTRKRSHPYTHLSCAQNDIPSQKADAAKTAVLAAIDGSRSPYFVAPDTLTDLKLVRRFYGLTQETYLEDTGFTSEGIGGRVGSVSGKQYPLVQPGGYWDLVIRSETDGPFWSQSFNQLVGQGLFQNPLISTAYERGYRDNFKAAGFPGVDAEFAEAQALFESVGAHTVLDLSCASGFMMRRLLRSRKYHTVFGADLSPDMLREARRRCDAEGIRPAALIRCDAARLPLRSETVDGVLAGAALHCWPRVVESLKEIYRVLSPGGAVFATTFLQGAYLVNGGGSTMSNKSYNQQTGFQFFSSLLEVKGLFEKAGFGEGSDGGMLNVRLEGRGCIIITATKGLVATG